jgi:hypothetical protein
MATRYRNRAGGRALPLCARLTIWPARVRELATTVRGLSLQLQTAQFRHDFAEAAVADRKLRAATRDLSPVLGAPSGDDLVHSLTV